MKVGENYKDYGKNLGSYFQEGWNERDWIKLGAAPVMAVGSLLGEGLEPLAEGVFNKKLESPSGFAGRTRRDIKALFDDAIHFRFPSVIRDGWSLLTSDIPLDAAEAMIGYHQKGTRHSVEHALEA